MERSVCENLIVLRSRQQLFDLLRVNLVNPYSRYPVNKSVPTALFEIGISFCGLEVCLYVGVCSSHIACEQSSLLHPRVRGFVPM